MKRIAIVLLFCSIAARAQDSPANTVAALGYLYPQPVTVAPGQVITLYISGSLPTDLGVTVNQSGTAHPAPVLDARPAIVCAGVQAPCPTIAAVNIQIPFEIAPTCFSCAVVVGFSTSLSVTANGVAGPAFSLTPLADRIHFLTTCDTVVSSGSGLAPVNGLPCPPFVTHADGSLVTSASPAQGDEVLVAYAVGLGVTNPLVPTGEAAPAATPTAQTFVMDFNYRANALPSKPIPPQPGEGALTRYAVPLFSGLTAGYVGLYQVNFQVAPPVGGVFPCSGPVESNLTVSMGGLDSFDGVGICLAP